MRGLVPLHGVGGRKDLPLPFELVVGASGVVVVLTFCLVIWAWRRSRWDSPGGRPLPRLTAVVDSPITRWVARGLVAAVTGVALLALVAGRDMVSNPFPGFLFVWIWIGLVPVSLLFGGVWRRLSVVRSLLAWRGATRQVDPLPRLGVWPAVAGLLAFAWLELVQPDRATIAVLRWWVLAWVVWVVGGALVRGGGWIASADPFEAYATTVARMSPWQRLTTPDGRDLVHWVNPLRQLASSQPPRGTWALAASLIGTTAFDSTSASTAWVVRAQQSAVPGIVLGSVGLVVLVALVWGLFWLGARAIARRSDETDVVNRLGLSVVPIGVGYVIAHYASLFWLEGQRVAITLSDPLSRGDNWFGTAEAGVDATLMQYPAVIAWVQVLGIVIGHVVGVVAAHDLALRWLPERHKVRAQLPMLLVMVVFTCGGLLLLFAN